MSIVVPSLDTDGFTSDVKVMLRRLYNYFLISEHSQTITYKESPVSLNHLLELYIDDLTILKIKTEDVLQIYLNKYFDTVEVHITIKDSEVTDTPSMDIAIKVSNNNHSTTLLDSVDISKDLAVRNGYVYSKLVRI